MSKIERCRIQKYDVNTPEPPHAFVTVMEGVEIERPDPEEDKDGLEFYVQLIRECAKRGMIFRFMSKSKDPDHDLDLVVAGAFERKHMSFYS